MQGQQFYEIYYVVWNHDLDVWSSENIASASFCILMNFKDVNDETVEIRPANGRSENEMWEKYVWNLWEFGFYLNFPNLKLNISVSREMFDLFIDFFYSASNEHGWSVVTCHLIKWHSMCSRKSIWFHISTQSYTSFHLKPHYD